MLALCPRHGFYFYPTPPAVDSAESINEKYLNSPDRHELEPPRLQGVITGPPVAAAGTNGTAANPGDYLNKKHEFSGQFQPFHISVDKGLELLYPIQNSLQLHPDLLSRFWQLLRSYPIQD